MQWPSTGPAHTGHLTREGRAGGLEGGVGNEGLFHRAPCVPGQLTPVCVEVEWPWCSSLELLAPTRLCPAGPGSEIREQH